MRKSAVLNLMAILSAVPATAQTTIEWPTELPQGVARLEPTAQMPHEHLLITNDSGMPRTWTISVVERPTLDAYSYEISGRVRYEDVEPAGYLEMWSHFGDRGAYFTRGLAESGPMGRLDGNSDWRPFSLPFRSSPDVGHPEKLVINVILPGSGTVAIGPITLAARGEGSVEPGG